MTSHHSPRQRRRSFLPRLEPLEGRCVPACTVTPSGTSLTITGDNNANTLIIDDNGAGVITVTCDGTVSGPFAGIQFINVGTGAGNDAVFYNLNDNLLTGQARVLQVALGGGNDFFRARSKEISAATDADLNTNSSLTINAFGQQGRDTFFFDFSKDFDIGAGAVLQVLVNGNQGRDVVAVDLLGQLEGNLTLNANGNQDRDKLAATIGLDVGSTGALNATLNGQGADDLLGLVVTRSRNVTTTATGQVNGGAGVNQAIVSNFVLVSGVSGDNLLRYPA
jgi:hypothetical protein